ncbi:MAG: hypothetical protein GY918_10495, partial [Gammaproteobacteria bacterium]|nr:hypothetical protein [Gammaproteobacteria bacterium]
MTVKTVAGVIKDAGNIAESTCSIKLDPVVSLGDTYKGAEYIETCDSSGNYSMTVPVGNYNVSISYDGGAKYTRLGAIQVVDDTPSPTTLAILLGNVQIPTNAQLLTAQNYSSSAAASASSAASDAAALNAHNLTGTEVAIGSGTGTEQGFKAVAVGYNAGETTQGVGTVAVGYYAGNSNQQLQAVAVGYTAGNTD